MSFGFTRLAIVCLSVVVSGCIVFVLLVAPLLPDAEQFIFSTKDDPTQELRLFDVSRRIELRLPSLQGFQPVWSPNGQQIVFVQKAEQTGSDSMMLVENVGQWAQQIYPAGTSASQLAAEAIGRTLWSQDASDLVFTIAGQDQLDLIWMQLQENITSSADVTELFSAETELIWHTPDRVRFAVVRRDQVVLAELQLGETTPQIVRSWPFVSTMTRTPVISPDGEKLVLPAITPTALNFELYLFDVQAETVLNITNRPSHNDTYPVWSANSEYVLYRSINDAGHFLIISALDGSTHDVVFHHPESSLSKLLWLPEEVGISFVARQGREYTLCILRGRDSSCPIQDAQIGDVAWRPA